MTDSSQSDSTGLTDEGRAPNFIDALGAIKAICAKIERVEKECQASGKARALTLSKGSQVSQQHWDNAVESHQEPTSLILRNRHSLIAQPQFRCYLLLI